VTKPAYVIGLDYGTNSVRCLIADAAAVLTLLYMLSAAIIVIAVIVSTVMTSISENALRCLSI